MSEHKRLHFLTPSYRGDLDRFLLLRRSIRRFALDAVEHVVAVPRADIARFCERLAGDEGVRVVAQQDVVSPQFYARAWVPAVRRMLGPHAWRIDRSRYAGRPGWIVQQIVKLSAPEFFGDGAVCMVDSDLLFVRPFSRADLLPDGPVRLLLRVEPADESAMHRDHMRDARRLLGLPPGPTDHHYMASPAVFYGEWVRQLRARLELVHSKPWQRVLREAETLSEYLLYGVFVEEILQPAALQVRRTPFHVGVWSQADAARLVSEPIGFVHNAPNAPLSMVFQSNLGLGVAEYLEAVEKLLAR